jgi:hypothetical protein
MDASRQPSSSSSLFVRPSGLVREASTLDAIIFNAVFSAPVGATLAFGIFYALGTSPGADLVQALLIAFVVNIPVCMCTQYYPLHLGLPLKYCLVTPLVIIRHSVHGLQKRRAWVLVV